jgi:hypothetical protein
MVYVCQNFRVKSLSIKFKHNRLAEIGKKIGQIL